MYFLQLSQLPNIQIVQYRSDLRITHLLTDSRKLIVNQGSVFFAIAGPRHDAHRYVYEAYEAGIRMFVVDQISKVDLAKLPEANIALASDTVAALQGIAASHRWQYQIDVLGITGSNAKTTIKEYLAQMLEGERSVVKSPKSYNSQIGVPLSVWLLNESHDLAIFEAGISTVGEMEKLEQVIRPTIGLFTNIGTAHDEGFGSQQEKVREKLKLFRNVDTLIYRADHALIDQEVQALAIPHFTWATHAEAHVKVTPLGQGKFLFARGTDSFEVAYPFVDPAAMENLSHCVVLLIHMGFAPHKIASLIRRIKNVAMRLELKQGINHCYLIDDTYNNDLAGLQIALEFLDQQNMRPAKSVILSDLIQSGPHQERVYADMAALLKSHHLKKIYAIGTAVSKYRAYFPPHTTYFSSTQDFLNTFSRDELRDEIVLIKGARSFAFEKIVERLAYKNHGTVLEINLEALAHNLNFYRGKLGKDTRVMAMVKALAYGSGSFEVAQLLQYHKVDYLGVAYTAEAVDLRNNGITLPIMVMNAAKENFADILQYKLEPEIYSFEILEDLIAFTQQNEIKSIPIHIDVDTGMRRLGFELEDLDKIVAILSSHPQIVVASVFSHLAGADEEAHVDFTKAQIQKFRTFAADFEKGIGRKVIKHICNSPGIVGYPEAHFDMVRLGVGLYGVEATQKEQSQLRAVSTLKSVIAQIKHVAAGETVGYGRRGVADVDKDIATINIGYADGYSRAFSRGVGHVLIRGKRAPIIGNVCMDMCMVDVTGMDVHVGDEVVLFGEALSILELASAIGTIPYEILTNVSERVKRVYYMG